MEGYGNYAKLHTNLQATLQAPPPERSFAALRMRRVLNQSPDCLPPLTAALLTSHVLPLTYYLSPLTSLTDCSS